MGDLYFHTGGTIHAHDYQRLQEILPQVQGKEELTILMEGTDSIQGDAIFELLDQNGFHRYVKGGGHDHYKVIARRKHG